MGFEMELFVESSIDNNLLCSVCRSVQESPTTVCDQAHTFCAPCIETWEERSNVCPDCRSLITCHALNQPVQSMIQSLQVRCPERSSRREWQGCLSGYLEEHRAQDCPGRTVDYSLGCGPFVRPSDMEDYEHTSCTSRLVPCDLFREEMSHERVSRGYVEMSFLWRRNVTKVSWSVSSFTEV